MLIVYFKLKYIARWRKMNLRLIKQIVIECELIDYSTSNENEVKDSEMFSLDYEVNKLESKKFQVRFILNITDKKIFSLGVCHLFTFETDEEIISDETEFSKNKIFNQNAPAIAYPYVRAFISTLMLNAGYPPLMLPSINLVEYSKRKFLNSKP